MSHLKPVTIKKINCTLGQVKSTPKQLFPQLDAIQCPAAWMEEGPDVPKEVGQLENNTSSRSTVYGNAAFSFKPFRKVR